MEQRVSLVTLGVADLARATAFYAALGWTPTSVDDDIAFFQAGGGTSQVGHPEGHEADALLHPVTLSTAAVARTATIPACRATRSCSSGPVG